ncbi:TetR/AcrR family transcriptional regulator [Actinoplanes sp. NPDC049316]|uniref:TetR/AcrR family transcriptional regulator n=1 Tax=Actinoplanes sp. NPDC049316 TaxID=3154727 RepID=UPI0034377A9D
MAVRSPGFGWTHAEQRNRARDLLLDTALSLFVEKGYIGVRVGDIAKAAGISRATFYKHFSEREEILAELFARLLGREPVPPPPGAAADTVARVRELLTSAAARMLTNEQLARFVYTLPIRHASLMGAGARPAVLDTVERLIEEGAAAGAIRDDIPAPFLTAHIARAFEAAMRDWAENRVPDALAHVETLLDLAFDGAMNRPGLAREHRVTGAPHESRR